MSNASYTPDDMQSLIDAAMNGSITTGQAADLQTLLENDCKACEIYAEYARIEAELHLLTRGRMANQAVCRGIGLQWTYGESISDDESFEVPLPASSTPVLSGGAWQGTIAIFSQIGPLSYLIATVVLSVMLLGAWAYKINHHDHFVNDQSPSIHQPEVRFVGHVTGMKDCRWVDEGAGTMVGASVPLGRKYALTSGLLEITYASGARVILEGPCTYRVDSKVGGYLELGKLTARVEKKKPQVVHPSSLFSVTTPTAIVTDLGTEFGVEVNENGDTTSHVFQGTVKVVAIGDAKRRETMLRENDSAVVLKDKLAEGVRSLTPAEKAALPKFVRRIYTPLKELDLLDIVAGGNGLGCRREHGIDPATGMYDPLYVPEGRGGDRQYRPISWHRLIDGVFVPDGRDGTVKINSAGDTFDGFPETNGDSWGSIWSRAADVKQVELATDTKYWLYAMGRGEQFMPQGRGLLCICANAGITFDLEAMRKLFADVHPARFRAIVGMVDAHFRTPAPTSMADVWVIVDGCVKFKRMKLRPEDGTLDVDVELEPSDRFLTLAFTDGGNDRSHDWLVFGDPVLKMSESEEK